MALMDDAGVMECPPWRIVKVEPGGLGKIPLARMIKMLAHEFVAVADIAIYMDASLKISGSLDEYVDRMGNEDMLVVKHRERSCVYEEMFACVRHKRATDEAMALQAKHYMRMGFPLDYGLFETQVIVRRNTGRMRQLNELWWSLTKFFGNWRDQLTLPLACRELNYGPVIVPWEVKAKYFIQEKVHGAWIK